MDLNESEFYVDLGGHRLLVISVGDGEPILLLHGALGSGQSHFKGQIPVLAERYRVLAPDLRGYGGSDRRTHFGPDFYQEDATDMAGLIQALRLGRVHVCGFSDGAVVALLLAIHRPDLVRSLTLIAGQSYVDEPTMEATRGWLPPESLPEGLRKAIARVQGEDRWQQLVVDYVAATEALYGRGGAICSDRLGEVQCKTLVIHGEADPFVAMIHPHLLAEGIPDARLRLFPGAGHYVQKEQTEGLNAELLRFLSAV